MANHIVRRGAYVVGPEYNAHFCSDDQEIYTQQERRDKSLVKDALDGRTMTRYHCYVVPFAIKFVIWSFLCWICFFGKVLEAASVRK